MKVLGIDPGLKEFGWAVINVLYDLNGYRNNGFRIKSKIDKIGNDKGKKRIRRIPKVKIVDWGVISTSEKDNLGVRLCSIGKRISLVLRKHQPEVIGIETPFVWRNPGSALKLGMVVGLCVEAARKYGGLIKFVAPISAKSRVTGFQFASKENVRKAVIRAIKNKSKFIKEKNDIPHHIWDAVSVAISSVS